jgi:16S rRNA (adenine1518-N6/adenine1519-N6)-dimethyltransferase
MNENNYLIEAKAVLRKFGQGPKKSLGQNFLINENILENIASLGEIVEGENIVEIGPGLGWLTEKLISFDPKLFLIEKDDNLALHLNDKFKSQVNLIHGDILDSVVWGKLPEEFSVIANLPYSITTPLITKIILSNKKIKKIVILVQKEVAERLSAPANSSERGPLTVFLEFFGETKLGPIVENTNFYPSPSVKSQILIINPFQEKSELLTKDFLDFLYKGFSQKRRKIKNSFKGGFGLDDDTINKLFEESNVDTNLRSEDLHKQDWENIWRNFQKMRQ